jgi:hypothetical protein
MMCVCDGLLQKKYQFSTLIVEISFKQMLTIVSKTRIKIVNILLENMYVFNFLKVKNLLILK